MAAGPAIHSNVAKVVKRRHEQNGQWRFVHEATRSSPLRKVAEACGLTVADVNGDVILKLVQLDAKGELNPTVTTALP
jgi:hypothetical protein